MVRPQSAAVTSRLSQRFRQDGAGGPRPDEADAERHHRHHCGKGPEQAWRHGPARDHPMNHPQHLAYFSRAMIADDVRWLGIAEKSVTNRSHSAPSLNGVSLRPTSSHRARQ